MTFRRFAVPLLAAVLAAAPAPARAIQHPIIAVSGGSTLAVTGQPSNSGLATTASLTWPVTGRFRAGVAGWADDLGTEVMRLADPVTGEYVGLRAELHRWSWGLGWVGEYTLADRGPWSLAGGASWTFHRVEDDERGATTRAISTAGAGAGLTMRRVVGMGQSLGLALRWQQIFVDRSEAADAPPPTFAPGTPPEVQAFGLRAWEVRRRSNLPSGWASAALEWRWARN
jgi:hypothetical protein